MENHLPPPQPHATTARGHAVANLKSLVLKCAIALAPARSLTLEQKTLLEKRIQDFAHTPDHPPYAWMIENAIKELNEEGGCSEEAISKFIVEAHKDLGWGHGAFLKHHLKRLTLNGTLSKTHDGCYLLVTEGHHNHNHNHNDNDGFRATCTTSTSTTSSWSPNSSDTSSCSWSFDQNKKRNYKRRNRRARKQNARTIVHPKHKKDAGDKEDLMNEVYRGDACTVEIYCLITEDEEAADENVKGNQDYVDLESEEQQTTVIDVDSLESESGSRTEPLLQNRGYNCSSHSGGIPSSNRRKLTRKKQKRNVHLRRKRQCHKRKTGDQNQLKEVEAYYMNNDSTAKIREEDTELVEQGEGDSTDELIEQVYEELTQTTIYIGRSRTAEASASSKCVN